MLNNMDFSSLSLEDTHYQELGVLQIQLDVFSTQRTYSAGIITICNCETDSETFGSLDIVQ